MIGAKGVCRPGILGVECPARGESGRGLGLPADVHHDRGLECRHPAHERIHHHGRGPVSRTDRRKFDEHRLAFHLRGRERLHALGIAGVDLEGPIGRDIEGPEPLHAHSILAGANRSTIRALHLEGEAVGVGLDELPVGGLEIAVVADRFEPGAPELGRDVLGGEVEPARRGVPAFKQVRGYEREVAAERIGRDPIEGRGLIGRQRRARRLWIAGDDPTERDEEETGCNQQSSSVGDRAHASGAPSRDRTTMAET
jgi:hypothetical protein